MVEKNHIPEQNVLMKFDRLHFEILWQKRWIRIVCFLFIWTLIGIIFASQLYLFALNTGRKTTLSYVLQWELTRWCLWAALTPWIIRLAHLHPIQTPHLVSNISRHVLISILVSLLHVLLFSLLYWLITSVTRAAESSGPFLSKLTSLDFLEPFEVLAFAFPLDFHLGIFVYWLILVLLLTVRFYRNAAQLQLELTKAQLQALKMQIHPHFLFNTLNSISALLHKDPQAADDMVGSLGDFLRLTLQNSGAEEIRLEKEMEFLKHYLDIEQIRFKGHLIAGFELELETLDAMVPNMLFQPIIENAIKHGIAGTSGPGHIDIRSKRIDGKLRVTIKDDGPGIGFDAAAREGIGLHNTRARLNHFYGDEHRLSLENVPEGGLLVTMDIPFRKSVKGALEESHAKNTSSYR